MDKSEETSIKPAPPVPSMLTEAQLIDDICNCVAEGATDSSICRALGIYPATFVEWKRKGREGQEPYRTFYIRYEQAMGLREMAWVSQIKDPRWLLTHHPQTKNAWAEIRYQKEERINVEKLDAKKDKIGLEIDKYFGLVESDDSGDEVRESSDEDPSEEALPEAVETA